jgi:hypothetical protein
MAHSHLIEVEAACGSIIALMAEEKIFNYFTVL